MLINPSALKAYNDFTPYFYDDIYLNIELSIPRDSDGPEFTQLARRLSDKGGIMIGKANYNPILDPHVYEVEYPDGHKVLLAANVITENLFSQS